MRLLALLLLTALATTPAQAQTAPTRVLTKAEHLLVSQRVEQDRPHEEPLGYDYRQFDDPKSDKMLERDWQRMLKLAEGYEKKPTTRTLREMQGLTNRYGIYGIKARNTRFGWFLTRMFAVVRAGPPPSDDPEFGNDPVLAAEWKQRYLRILAAYVWQTDPGGDLWHLAAGYLAPCERRPSLARPSGNHHDPDCGFLIESTYAVAYAQNEKFDPRRVPQTFADFAEDAPNPDGRIAPLPKNTRITFYPLWLPEGSPQRNQLWAGNERALQMQYSAPYLANREFLEADIAYRKAAAAPILAREEQMRQYRRAAEAAQKVIDAKLDARWDELWAMSSLAPALQVELEEIAFRRGRLDVYRGRYSIVQIDRLRSYCDGRWYPICDSLPPPPPPQQASGGGGGYSAPGVYSVQVRTYDRNGNYVGTTTTTPVVASLLGSR